MVHAQAHPQRHALAVVGAADAIDDALLGDLGRELVAMCQGDPVEHQVQRGRAAGAGEAVAVDLVEVRGDRNLRERLDEARQVLPVDRAAMAVEQAGAGQHVCTRAQGADLGAAAVPAAQPGEHLLVLVVLRAQPAAQDQGRQQAGAWRLRRRDGGLDLDRDAVARGEPAPPSRDSSRQSIERPTGQAVGDAKGSIALVKAIIEKSGISKKRIVSVASRSRGGRSLMVRSERRA